MKKLLLILLVLNVVCGMYNHRKKNYKASTFNWCGATACFYTILYTL